MIGIGLGLIGLCHLPIRFGARVGLVAVAGAGLAFLRAHSQWFPDVTEMWVILGSMFMFRLMIYLYDLKHRTAPFSPARAISYFFLLPNVCFPLFPVVDYKTFCSTYYNEDWPRIYQTGLKWMFRGVIQLLLYRLVYQYAPLDVSKLSSALDVAGCMLGMYLLYLRISGTFHLIVGLLLMFGFNLPETHHLYYLATSFTDFWRRINIYWKDFVMKLFFYPIHFKLRKMGTLSGDVSGYTGDLSCHLAAALLAMVLDSWQAIVRLEGLFLLDDSRACWCWSLRIYETTRGRKRTLTPSRVTLRQRLILGLQAAGIFSLMCILWAYWSCQSWAEFQTLIDAASRPTLREMMIVFGALAVDLRMWDGVGVVEPRNLGGPLHTGARKPFSFWPSAGAVSVGALCLLVAPSVATRTIPSIKNVIARLQGDVLNARDLALQRRGYYEELDVGRMDNWQRARGRHAGGTGVKVRKCSTDSDPTFCSRTSIRRCPRFLAALPSASNSLGMRDREYDTTKPPNTYRIVLLGASHDQGSGVKEDETYENVVEDRLNRELPDSHYSRYEILNMSVGMSGLFQRLLRLEEQGFQFKPDAVILSVAAADKQFLFRHLSRTLSLGIEPPPDYRQILERVTRSAGIHGKMPEVMIERRLQPYGDELYEWAFQRFAQQCKQRGIHPLVIYRPATCRFRGSEHGRANENHWPGASCGT